MSIYWKGNQRERRRKINTHAGLHPAIREAPRLPLDKTTYSAHCISQLGRHNCCISCEYMIDCVSTHTCHLYICDNLGFPIELWEHTYDNLHNITTYNHLWQRMDLHYVARFCELNRTKPSPIHDGYTTYEPNPLIGREPKSTEPPFIPNRTRDTPEEAALHKGFKQADLKYRQSPAGRLHSY